MSALAEAATQFGHLAYWPDHVVKALLSQRRQISFTELIDLTFPGGSRRPIYGPPQLVRVHHHQGQDEVLFGERRWRRKFPFRERLKCEYWLSISAHRVFCKMSVRYQFIGILDMFCTCRVTTFPSTPASHDFVCGFCAESFSQKCLAKMSSWSSGLDLQFPPRSQGIGWYACVLALRCRAGR